MELRIKRNIAFKACEALATIAASFLQMAFITRCYPGAAVGQYQLVLAWLFIITAFSFFAGNSMITTRDPLVGSLGAAISTVFTEFAICGFCLWMVYRVYRGWGAEVVET